MAKSYAVRRAARLAAEALMTVREKAAARRERELMIMHAIFGFARWRNTMDPPFLFTAYKPPVIVLSVKGTDAHVYGATAIYLPTGVEYAAIMIEYAGDLHIDAVFEAMRVRHGPHGLAYDATGALCLGLTNRQPNPDGNKTAILLHGPENELRTMFRAVKVKPAAETRT